MTEDTKIHTILQSFVDLNLETDENSVFSLEILDISFNQSSQTINEGDVAEIIVSLNKPSVNGWEEVEIGVIANNTSFSDFNNLGETYPRTLLFSAGQQSHTLRFLANEDFIEESIESFEVIIGSFTNTNPGKYITSTINIINQTNLKEVFFNEEGGNFQISTLTNASTLTFSAIEGASKQITISLDSPSVFGIETASVKFTNNTVINSNYSIIGTTNFSWNIGDKDKTFIIESIDDNKLEDTEIIEMEIVGVSFANIINPSKAEFKIFDNSPKTLFANINFQGLYTQIGGFNFQNITNLRHIINNGKINNGSGDETMLLKFGEKFKSVISTLNNSPIVGICGDNCERSTFDNKHTDIIYFGQNPNTGEYGDVKLIITSRGQFPVIINGNQINPGESITFDVDAFDYNITLPANNNLVLGGTFVGNILFSLDTITNAVYEFAIKSSYNERQFVMKDLTNNIANNNTINLGVHTFIETYDLINATNPANQHNLVTTYNQVLAGWNINSNSCISSGSFFPSNPIEAISIENRVGHARINGFAILSDNSKFLGTGAIGDGPSAFKESSYVSVEFLPNGQTINRNCTPFTFNGNNANKVGWTTLEFEIIP